MWLQRHMHSIAVAPCCKHIHCIHKLWLHCRNQRDFHSRLFMCQKAVAQTCFHRVYDGDRTRICPYGPRATTWCVYLFHHIHRAPGGIRTHIP